MNKSGLRRTILRWYDANKRDLPWRGIEDPYKILVSEVMLQQTQVDRVTKFFLDWIISFPTIEHLAAAEKGTVLRRWSGLGYNNRALRLRQLARIVVEKFSGVIPDDPEVLRTLPGIGRYTANAVACFAFKQKLPVVDINIRRIFTRISHYVKNADELMPENESWKMAKDFLSRTRADDWNQALMDIGSLFCTSGRPLCGKCPLRRSCSSAFSASLNKKSKKRKKKEPAVGAIPRRIIRGKILTLLQTKSLQKKELLDSLVRFVPEISSAELAAILLLMKKDDLISFADPNSLNSSIFIVH